MKLRFLLKEKKMKGFKIETILCAIVDGDREAFLCDAEGNVLVHTARPASPIVDSGSDSIERKENHTIRSLYLFHIKG